ncbi:MAG: response regulator [Acidobacteriota bacterium]
MEASPSEPAGPVSASPPVPLRRILFVDDDPSVLDGLRHRLRRQRHRWDMVFVGGGEAALEVLAREPIDVIVTDLRMPHMDGATLLQLVQQQHPQVIRIVLSGHAERETAMMAAGVAHQFLSKPSEHGLLENVIERSCNLHLLIQDARIKRLVGRVGHLPSMPQVYHQIRAAVEQQDGSAAQVAFILKQDIAICAKVLQLVNSAFFRLYRSIVDVEEAVAYLGFDTIQRITLAVELFQQSRGVPGPRVHEVEALHKHGVLVGQIAAGLFADKRMKEDAFVVGLLHDIGKLVLVVGMPEHMDRATLEAQRSGCSLYEAEATISGVTHAEVGAYLLGLWGLQYSVVEAVAYHHTPWKVDTSEMALLTGAYIADGLARELLAAGSDQPQPVWLDQGYLDRIGVGERMTDWREMASREVAKFVASTA